MEEAAKHDVTDVLNMHIFLCSADSEKEEKKRRGRGGGCRPAMVLYYVEKCYATSRSRTLGTATKASSPQQTKGRLSPRQLQHNAACHVRGVGRSRGTARNRRQSSRHFGDCLSTCAKQPRGQRRERSVIIFQKPQFETGMSILGRPLPAQHNYYTIVGNPDFTKVARAVWPVQRL